MFCERSLGPAGHPFEVCAGVGVEGNDDRVFRLPLRTAGSKALSLVVQLGNAEPAASDGGSGADAEAAVSKHHDLSSPPHQPTQASESVNAKIKWVKYTARGFRNQQNFIEDIEIHCGGLTLSP